MTASSSPRARRVDWDAVRRIFEAVDSPQSTAELAPAWQRREIPEPRWAPEYVTALEQALDQADASELIRLLEARRLIHPLLLPLLAEFLRRKLQGLSVGKPKKLLAYEERLIRKKFEHRKGTQTASEFDAEMAIMFRVGDRTIANARRKKTPTSSS
jgi:hypothetical protein